MRLRIEHKTTFIYDEPITEAYTEMRLKPSDAGGQHCLSFSLITEPRGSVMKYADRYGNDVRHFDVLMPHQKVGATAISEVLTAAVLQDPEQTLSPLNEHDYLMPTDYSPRNDPICDFVKPFVVAGDPLQTALAIMHAIFTSFTYEPGATDVKTTADEVLALRRGVCQDFAHVMLSACRCVGLPARYVSGYLYDPKLVGANAASHAWVDVFVPGPGWVSLDPTHDRQQTGNYVRVGVGRDYADVPPTRGTYKGSGKETLDVQVSVLAV
ncbi:MAG: transglutaminase family protein [Anaerolineae bacterium]|nr:transglutaminase family protein [Anaerolineae bacterium]